MLLMGSGGPAQLNYLGRPPAGYQTILARQQIKSNFLFEIRTAAVVVDQLTLNGPSGGGKRLLS